MWIIKNVIAYLRFKCVEARLRKSGIKELTNAESNYIYGQLVFKSQTEDELFAFILEHRKKQEKFKQQRLDAINKWVEIIYPEDDPTEK